MTYRIKGDWLTRRVWVDAKQLSPVRSQRIRNHSPDGFNWGYGGAGSAQLALALCVYFLRDHSDGVPVVAVETQLIYQEFKAEFVAKWPEEDFEIDVNFGEWYAKKKEN